jgi:hypothetical protein
MRKTTGISLMLLIFLSLFLMTFALLSLTDSTADLRLSNQAADRTTEYYAAETAANLTLAQIDLWLAEAYQSSDSVSNYAELCASLADSHTASDSRTGEKISLVWSDSAKNIDSSTDLEDTGLVGTLSWEMAVNENQILSCTLGICYPSSDEDSFYQILSWETVNTREWKADTSQNLFRQNSDSADEVNDKE